MDATTAGLLGAAIGGMLTAVPTIITFWIGKRSEDRKQLRELAFRGAFDNWKQVAEMSQRSGLSGVVEPFDVFLFHMLKLADVAIKDGLTVETVADRMKEVNEIVLRASETATAFTSRYQGGGPAQKP
jgi:hypothetical protein